MTSGVGLNQIDSGGSGALRHLGCRCRPAQLYITTDIRQKSCLNSLWAGSGYVYANTAVYFDIHVGGLHLYLEEPHFHGIVPLATERHRFVKVPLYIY